MKLRNEDAIKITIRLAEENIKSSNSWTFPDNVIDFMDKIYQYFTSDTPKE